MKNFNMDKIILSALDEDRSSYDLTSEYLFDESHLSKAKLIAKEDGIISGVDVFERTFTLVDSDVHIKWSVFNGESIKRGQELAEIEGRTKSLLFAERTGLNFIQRLSGIATETRKYVQQVESYSTKIVDTRKTAPGMRVLDKRAVKDGGGHNHRFNLSDGILIKDNHIKASGGITQAIKKIKENVPHTLKIEVEVESIEGLMEAIDAGADIVMLDNMTDEMMGKAVAIANKKVLLEASGNMTLERISSVAKLGVDIISVGALTHSVKALDISLRFV